MPAPDAAQRSGGRVGGVMVAAVELVDGLVVTVVGGRRVPGVGGRPGAGFGVNADAPLGPARGRERAVTVGKNGSLYAIALGWPGPELRINAPFPIDGKDVVLLGSNGKALLVRHDGNAIVITTGATHASQVTSSKDAFVFRIA